MLLSDTIVAISTPPGKGGVAIIRISGTDALPIGEKLFRPKGKCRLCDNPRMQIYGYIVKGGDLIDDVMATYFKRGSSFTGEDTVEIACHGGSFITHEILEAAMVLGARRASAGEFTRRAFVNGKITLTDAEQIGLLLDAQSYGQLKLSRIDARMRLRDVLSSIREALTSLLGSIYARIDYPDEDLGELSEKTIVDELTSIKKRTEALLATYKTGHAVCEGISTVIAGIPNAGKSTLYNMLTGGDEAIVTEIAGTTRDVLHEKISIGDLMLNLYDTAGIREIGSDVIEGIGIERSKKKMAEAELILAVFDGASEISREEEEFIRLLTESGSQKIIILSKSDIGAATGEKEKRLEAIFGSALHITDKDPIGAVNQLKDKIAELFNNGNIDINTDAIISTARQNADLYRTLDHINCALDAYSSGLSEDAASSDIELALGAIAELEGVSVSESVVSDIFSRFCVGK